jgi:hypothetical protein
MNVAVVVFRYVRAPAAHPGHGSNDNELLEIWVQAGIAGGSEAEQARKVASVLGSLMGL